MNAIVNAIREEFSRRPLWLAMATLALAVAAFISLMIQSDPSLILYEAF